MAESHRDPTSRVDPERRVADLMGVLDAARRLATLTELSAQLSLAEQVARRLLDCAGASVFLHDPLKDELMRRATDERAGARLACGRGLLGEVFRRKIVVNCAEPPLDARLIDDCEHMLEQKSGSVLACPVLDGDDNAVGVLLAVDSHRGRFDAWDEVLARALMTQAGAAIHRYGLSDLDRARRLTRDLEVAREIQQAMFPRRPPVLEGYDIAGWFRPVDETGGDFFDFQDRGDGRLVVAVGDVSGHGFGPALVVAECRAFFHATLLQTDDPVQVIDQVNKLLCQDELEDRFVTAFFGVLERDAHRLDYVSAGQGPILFFSRCGSTIEELEVQGFPLGLSPVLSFGPHQGIAFAPGDLLALITDGFFEWFNPRGECFGIERMKEQINGDRDRSAAEIIERLHRSVLDFADGTPQPDDLTAVVIKRQA